MSHPLRDPPLWARSTAAALPSLGLLYLAAHQVNEWFGETGVRPLAVSAVGTAGILAAAILHGRRRGPHDRAG